MGEKLKLLKAQMLNACTTIYDEEAMTGLELSARTACKVNECVKMVNFMLENMETLVEEHIADLINTGSFRIENDILILDKAGEE